MKTRTGSTKGSVLVMVVGLLTIIAMLGSMFLLVARMNRRTAEAMDAVAPDSLVQGIVDQVKAQMLADLHIGEYNPAGATEAEKNLPYFGGATAADYADFPGEGNDPWLATNYTASVWDDKEWPHITNISGEPSIADPERKVTDVSVNNKFLRDTNGDGFPDAIHYRMEVFNSNGDEYCAAVRVIDLGGLICVNTAGEYPGTTPPYTTPVSVNLKGFLNSLLGSDDVYDSLNGVRTPDGDEDDMDALWTNLASHPSAPGAGYTSFGVGDEMYLRWLTFKENSSTFTGPLFNATQTGEIPLNTNIRRFLTTLSCSRNLLRQPQKYLKTRIPLRTTDYFDDISVPTGETLKLGELRRNALYEILVEALGSTDDAARVTAAHFVANLWAYMDGQDPDKSYGFEVTGHSASPLPKVYGVIPQPFVTEVFAYNLQDSTPSSPTGDDGHASAIELYNPSTNEIELAGKYQIEKVGGATEPFPAGAKIPANGRFVIYHIEGDFDHDNNASTARVPGTEAMYGIPTTNSWDWDQLDFRTGSDVEYKISRVPVAGTEIPIDSVTKGSGKDIDFTATDGNSNTELLNICRDDSANNRYALNTSIEAHSGNISCVNVPSNNTLGAYNNLTGTQINSITDLCGFTIAESRPNGATSVTPMSTVADIMKLFLVGPINDDSLVTQLTSKATDPSRGYANELATFATLSNTKYPPVPLGCALGELFAVIPLVDPLSDPIDSRVYGRLNINTATRETLLMLPWPDTVNGVDLTTTTAPNKADIVDAILAARGTTGFTTPGQLATVLGMYFDTNLIGSLTTASSNYLEERGKLYKAVADLITVNSDVYAITMRVSLEDTLGAVKYSWNYISVVDRSNCFAPSDTPNPVLPADKVK